jgi:hypothetical protein
LSSDLAACYNAGMTLSIDISSESLARLRAKAEMSGVDVGDYVSKIVEKVAQVSDTRDEWSEQDVADLTVFALRQADKVNPPGQADA